MGYLWKDTAWTSGDPDLRALRKRYPRRRTPLRRRLLAWLPRVDAVDLIRFRC